MAHDLDTPALPDRILLARRVLDSLTLPALTASTFEAAARLEPPMPGSLDALQLAAALTLGDDLESFVTHDDRLAFTARANALPVTAPR